MRQTRNSVRVRRAIFGFSILSNIVGINASHIDSIRERALYYYKYLGEFEWYFDFVFEYTKWVDFINGFDHFGNL